MCCQVCTVSILFLVLLRNVFYLSMTELYVAVISRVVHFSTKKRILCNGLNEHREEEFDTAYEESDCFSI